VRQGIQQGRLPAVGGTDEHDLPGAFRFDTIGRTFLLRLGLDTFLEARDALFDVALEVGRTLVLGDDLEHALEQYQLFVGRLGGTVFSFRLDVFRTQVRGHGGTSGNVEY